MVDIIDTPPPDEDEEHPGAARTLAKLLESRSKDRIKYSTLAVDHVTRVRLHLIVTPLLG